MVAATGSTERHDRDVIQVAVGHIEMFLVGRERNAIRVGARELAQGERLQDRRGSDNRNTLDHGVGSEVDDVDRIRLVFGDIQEAGPGQGAGNGRFGILIQRHLVRLALDRDAGGYGWRVSAIRELVTGQVLGHRHHVDLAVAQAGDIRGVRLRDSVAGHHRPERIFAARRAGQRIGNGLARAQVEFGSGQRSISALQRSRVLGIGQPLLLPDAQASGEYRDRVVVVIRYHEHVAIV